MHIGDAKVVVEYDSNPKVARYQVSYDDLEPFDKVIQKQEGYGKQAKKQDYRLGALTAVDLKERSFFYDNLGDEPEKSFKGDAIPMLRWISCVAEDQIDWDEAKRLGRKKGDGKGKWPSKTYDSDFTEYYLEMTNDILNDNFFELYAHPELQWLLMSMLGAGTPQQHQWISKKRDKQPHLDKVLLKWRPGISVKELDLLKSVNSWSAIEILCLKYAMSDDEIKKVKADFDDFNK